VRITVSHISSPTWPKPTAAFSPSDAAARLKSAVQSLRSNRQERIVYGYSKARGARTTT
jgi:hypothetical protein